MVDRSHCSVKSKTICSMFLLCLSRGPPPLSAFPLDSCLFDPGESGQCLGGLGVERGRGLGMLFRFSILLGMSLPMLMALVSPRSLPLSLFLPCFSSIIVSGVCDFPLSGAIIFFFRRMPIMFIPLFLTHLCSTLYRTVGCIHCVTCVLLCVSHRRLAGTKLP